MKARINRNGAREYAILSEFLFFLKDLFAPISMPRAFSCLVAALPRWEISGPGLPRFLLRALPALLAVSGALAAGTADTNNLPDAASSLRPPRGELLPTFWEQYGGWVILAGVVLLVGLAFLVWLLTRPKPVVPVPWSVQARRELERCRQQADERRALGQAPQILRHHLASPFGLTPGEATTSEFRRALSASQKVGPELAAALGDFLKECDLRKFAAAPPPTSYDAMGQALKIIEMAENRLADLGRVGAVSIADSASAAPGKPAGQRVGA